MRARAHLFDAQATLHLEGRLAPLEDLVLHEAGMDARRPTPELSRAAMVLATRRRVALSAPGWPFSPEGWSGLLGAPLQDEDEEDEGRGLAGDEFDATPRGRREAKPWDMPRFGSDDLLIDEDEDEEALDSLGEPEIEDRADSGAFADIDQLLARTRRSLAGYNDLASEEGRRRLKLHDPAFGGERRLAAWRRAALTDTRRLPAVLAAAVALDAWFALDPSERRAHLGPLLAASLLRWRGKTPAHLPALALGWRESGYRWSPVAPAAERLEGLLAAIEAAARHGGRDFDKLTLARQVMLERCKGVRRTSRLPRLVDQFVSTPLVTVATAAKALKTSPQAVEGMLADLGPACPRELTERKRYRAWGIV